MPALLYRFRKTVPVSSSSTNLKKAFSDSEFASALVHMEAVRPYGESLINLIASSSEDTYRRGRELALYHACQLNVPTFCIPTTGPKVSSCGKIERNKTSWYCCGYLHYIHGWFINQPAAQTATEHYIQWLTLTNTCGATYAVPLKLYYRSHREKDIEGWHTARQ